MALAHFCPLLRLLLADHAVVAVEVLLNGAQVSAKLVYHDTQLWRKAEEGERLANLKILQPRKDLATAIEVDDATVG